MKKFINLADGSGGKEMSELISLINNFLAFKGGWICTDEDAAVYTNLHENEHEYKGRGIGGPGKFSPGEKNEDIAQGKEKLVFTTDAFVVDPIFFKGGNIGDLAFNGTLNDLLVQGADPLGISLAMVLEEGFPVAQLKKILSSVAKISKQVKVPVVTGDTKVVPKGALDKIMITTAGIGLAGKIISDRGITPGDKIIASGDLGAHGATLLAQRFNYKSSLISDTKPLFEEIMAVREFLTSAKDSTRGGMAAVLNEMAEKSQVKIVLDEKKIPMKKEARAISRLLGINEYSLASEGRFVGAVSAKDTDKVIRILKKLNKEARIMGEAVQGNGVYIKNLLGEKKLRVPEGILIPRIC